MYAKISAIRSPNLDQAKQEISQMKMCKKVVMSAAVAITLCDVVPVLYTSYPYIYESTPYVAKDFSIGAARG